MGKLWSACALATVLTVAPASTAVQAREAAANSAGVRDLSNIRIGNFGQISGAYYRGEQPEGRDYADLAALGVKTVIDL